MKFFKFNILVFGFLLLISIQLWAQDTKVVRLEVPSNIEVETFNVEPLGSNGVLIFYQSNEVNEDGDRKWYFGLFDTSLKQIWLKFIPLSDKMEYIEPRRSGKNLHMLFRNMTRGRLEDGYYEIVNLDLTTSVFTKVSGKFPIKAEIAGFEVIGNTGCIALNLNKEATDLVFVDLTTGDITPVNVLEGSKNFILKLYADQAARKFLVALKTLSDNRYLKDEIVSYTNYGKKYKEYKVQAVEGIKMLSDFVFVPMKNDELTVMGTYSIVTGKINTFDDLIETDDAKGAGLFFLQFNGEEQTALKYYDFLSFKNIYGSLGSRVVEIQKGSKTEDGSSEKIMNAYYHLFAPQVIQMNDQYVFSVEVYKPFYQTETRMEYDYYGRPVPYTYNVFSGYSFYDVILAGLSEKGDFIWDNDFIISDVKTYKKARQSIVFQDGNFVSIANINDGKVLLQTIEGSVDIGKAETTIESKISKDRVASDEFNNIRHWYDDYFLIYGYQKLKNRTLDDQNLRTVFYANKIAYK